MAYLRSAMFLARQSGVSERSKEPRDPRNRTCVLCKLDLISLEWSGASPGTNNSFDWLLHSNNCLRCCSEPRIETILEIAWVKSKRPTFEMSKLQRLYPIPSAPFPKESDMFGTQCATTVGIAVLTMHLEISPIGPETEVALHYLMTGIGSAVEIEIRWIRWLSTQDRRSKSRRRVHRET